MKDLASGEERPVLKGNVKVLGWYDNRIAIVNVNDFTYKLNVDTGEKVTIFEGTDQVNFAAGYMMKRDFGSLTIVDAETGEEKIFTADGLGEQNIILGSPDSQYLAILNRPDTSKYEVNIILLHVESMKYWTIPSPSNSNIENINWYNEKELYVNVRLKDGSNNEETYIFNIGELGER